MIPSKPTFVLSKTFALGTIAGKKTEDCMIDELWDYRSDHAFKGLPVTQATQPAVLISVYELRNTRGASYSKIAAAILSVDPNTPRDQLAALLKERGHTLTLPAVEYLVQREECGDGLGLIHNVNHTFVEDVHSSISVFTFIKHKYIEPENVWSNYVSTGLNESCDYSSGSARFLVRNLNAPVL